MNYKNGAISVRVSSDRQTEYSPDSQIKLCLKYAEENNIFVSDDHIYRDDGISGKSAENRESFQRMIDDAKKKPKPFDVILVYDFSRFARNKEESVIYKAMLRKRYGIDVISITQPLGDGKERVILESMYEAMDEYYLLNLAENISRGRMEKASRGEWNGGIPFGYDRDSINKSLKINEEESKIVKYIFKLFLEHKKYLTVATILNNENILQNNGKKWSRGRIRYIVSNVAYNGYLTNGKDNVFKGKHEKIIDDSTWKETQKIIDINNLENAKYQKTNTSINHWLKGIIKCSKCGGTLVLNKARKNKNPIYFQCSNYSKSKCKKSHYISLKRMENTIINEIENVFKDKLDINISTTEETLDDKEQIIIDKLAIANKKLERSKTAYLNGIDSIDEYKQNKKDISKEISILEKELKTVENKEKKKNKKEEVYKDCKYLHTLLKDENTNEDLKYYLSHKLFDKIIYDKNRDEITIFYY